MEGPACATILLINPVQIAAWSGSPSVCFFFDVILKLQMKRQCPAYLSAYMYFNITLEKTYILDSEDLGGGRTISPGFNPPHSFVWWVGENCGIAEGS